MVGRPGGLIGGLGLALALGALSGCTSPEKPPATPPAPPPQAADLSESEDIARQMGECLQDAGFDVTVSGTSVSFLGPDEQTSAFNDANDVCYEDLGFADDVAPDITEALIERAYERELESWACLAAEGYEVAEVPSYAVYKDRLLAADDYSTWRALPPMAEAELKRLGDVCPDPMARFFEDD